MDEKFDYFMDETNKRLDKIDKKLELLISFRTLLLGASISVSAIVSLIIEIFIKH